MEPAEENTSPLFVKHLDLLRVAYYLSEYFYKINIIYLVVKARLLLFFIFWNIVSIHAQLKEHFNHLDAWKADSSQWQLTDGMLQSKLAKPNTSFSISTSNNLTNDCVWKLNCTLHFATSSLNFVDYYLLSDTDDLANASNAYFVRIGSSSDDICLYKKSNGIVTKLIDGTNGRSQTSSSFNQIQLKVVRNKAFEWHLYDDNISNGDNYIKEGSAKDTITNQLTGYTGIVIYQSSSSFWHKHYFDDYTIQTITEDSLENQTNNLKPIAGDIIISELLFNPRPNGVDFIELYNRSDKPMQLSNLKLANEKGDTVNFKASKYTISPHSYLAITTDTSVVQQQYPSAQTALLHQCSKLPSLNDTEGYIAILNRDQTILDAFYYTDKLHFDLLIDKEGISLEKINLYMSSNASNWHSASTEVGYATPGLPNSQHASSNNVQSFTVSNSILSPDQDGNNDFVLIEYQLKQPGTTANINIYNTAGENVKQIANNHLLSSNGMYQWDGVSDKGELVHKGYYLIRIEMLHQHGANEVTEIPIVVWND